MHMETTKHLRCDAESLGEKLPVFRRIALQPKKTAPPLMTPKTKALQSFETSADTRPTLTSQKTHTCCNYTAPNVSVLVICTCYFSSLPDGQRQQLEVSGHLDVPPTLIPKKSFLCPH